MELSNNFSPRVSTMLDNGFNNTAQGPLTPVSYFPNNFNSSLSLSVKKNDKEMKNVSLFPAEKFSKKEETEILKSFKSGLKLNKISEVYLSAIISGLKFGNFNVNEFNIVNPDNIDEIKSIQEKINEKIETPEAKEFGLAKKLPVNGHFDKKMISYLLFINETQNHGSPVKLDITPIKQVGSRACFLTSEAMYFNYLHQKDGKSDAYNEFDARERIKRSDRRIENDTTPGIISENSKGRISIRRDKGLALVKFIDSELDTKKPVLVGVSSRKQEQGKEYNEGITDHYVLITGKDYDQYGVFYTFNDTVSGGKDDKLRLDPLSGKLYGFGDKSRKYDVTEAVSYKKIDEKDDFYKMIGKPVARTKMNIIQIQNDFKNLGYNVSVNGKYSKSLTDAVKTFQSINNLPVTGNVDSYTFEKLELAGKNNNFS